MKNKTALVLVNLVITFGGCKSRSPSSSQKSVSSYNSSGYVDFIYIPINKSKPSEPTINSPHNIEPSTSYGNTNTICFATCSLGTTVHDDSRGKSFNPECKFTGYAEVSRAMVAASGMSQAAQEVLSKILSSEETQVSSEDPFYRELLEGLLPLLNTDSAKDVYCGQ